MSGNEHVMLEFSMLPEEAEALKRWHDERGREVVADFQLHEEPLGIGVGKVKSVTRTGNSEK